MKFTNEIQALQVSPDANSEVALVLSNNIVKKRDLSSLYLKNVQLNFPTIFNPITGNATPGSSDLTFSLKSQTRRQVFAAPNGGNGTPDFRALLLDDISDYSQAGVNYWTKTGNDLSYSAGKVWMQDVDIASNKTLKMNDGATIVFSDKRGIYPTNSQSAFVWDLNNDSARIYAQQPSSDSIDFVFKLTDNAASTDRFVWWIDEWRGSAFDSFPIYADSDKFVVNYINHFDPTASGSKSTHFYVLKTNATSITESVLLVDVNNSRVSINNNANYGAYSLQNTGNFINTGLAVLGSTTTLAGYTDRQLQVLGKAYISSDIKGNGNFYLADNNQWLGSTGNLIVKNNAGTWGKLETKHIDSITGQFLHLNYYSTESVFVGNGSNKVNLYIYGRLFANNTTATAGQFLKDNGTSTYWSNLTAGDLTDFTSAVNTLIAQGQVGTNYWTKTGNNLVYNNGNIGIGIQNDAINLNIEKGNSYAGTTSWSVRSIFTGNINNTGGLRGFNSYINTAVSAYTVNEINHFRAEQGTFGAGSTVNYQMAFLASNNLVGAVNNYGFFGMLPSATGNWNLFMTGTASNFMRGKLLLGIGTDYSSAMLQVNGKGSFSDNVYVGSNWELNSAYRLQVAGDQYITGKITFQKNGTYPQTFVDFNDGQPLMRILTSNGGLSIGRDDCIIIGAGESRGIIESNIPNLYDEAIYLAGEGGVRFISTPDNWGSNYAGRNESSFNSQGNWGFGNGGSNGAGERVNVSGSINYSGTLSIGGFGNKGTNGQFLKTTGTANAWASLTAGDLTDFTSAVNTLISQGQVASNYWTKSTNHLYYASGNVAVGSTDTSLSKMYVYGATIGNTLGDYNSTLLLRNNNGNNDLLEFGSLRDSSATSWTSAGFRIQQKIDSTWMAFMQFNGTGNASGISFGTGTSLTSRQAIPTRMIINSSGNVGINADPLTSKFLVNQGGYGQFIFGYAGISRTILDQDEIYLRAASQANKAVFANGLTNIYGTVIINDFNVADSKLLIGYNQSRGSYQLQVDKGAYIQNTVADGIILKLKDSVANNGIDIYNFGMYFSRQAVYLNPTVNDYSALYIGQASDTKRWNAIVLEGSVITLNSQKNYALLKTDSTGVIQQATASDVISVLGDSYIKNQSASNQTASFKLFGSGSIDSSGTNVNLNLYRTDTVYPMFRMNTSLSGASYIDFNPYISGVSNGGFEIKINGGQRFVIDTTGRVGIGTNTPSGILSVTRAGVAGMLIGHNETSENYFDANSNIFRAISGAEVMRTMSLKLLIGNQSERGPFQLQVAGSALVQDIWIHQGGHTTSVFVGQSSGANSTGSGNSGFGANSLASNTTGTSNVAVGFSSMNGNQTGVANVAVGQDTLFHNVSGQFNSAIGYQSMVLSVKANFSVANGAYAMYNANDSYAVAIGTSALRYNGSNSGSTYNSFNVAIGYAAMNGNALSGYESDNYFFNNVAIGAYTMHKAKTVTYSVAVGMSSLQEAFTSTHNTSVGHESQYLNTTGSYNVTLGSWALKNNQTSNGHTAIGMSALKNLTTGDYNVGLGTNAGTNLTNGGFNLFLGAVNCGLNVGTGSANVIIGSNTGTRINGLSNYMIFSDGSGAERFSVTNAGYMLIGRIDSIGAYRLQVNGTIQIEAVKSAFVKTNALGAMEAATKLDFQNILGDDSYILNQTDTPQAGGFYVSGNGYASGGFFATGNVSSGSDRRLKSDIVPLLGIRERVKDLELKSYIKFGQKDLGYIAQDLQEIFPELVSEYKNGYLGINYGGVAALALQLGNENANEIDNLKQEIKRLKEKLNEHGIAA